MRNRRLFMPVSHALLLYFAPFPGIVAGWIPGILLMLLGTPVEISVFVLFVGAVLGFVSVGIWAQIHVLGMERPLLPIWATTGITGGLAGAAYVALDVLSPFVRMGVIAAGAVLGVVPGILLGVLAKKRSTLAKQH